MNSRLYLVAEPEDEGRRDEPADPAQHPREALLDQSSKQNLLSDARRERHGGRQRQDRGEGGLGAENGETIDLTRRVLLCVCHYVVVGLNR